MELEQKLQECQYSEQQLELTKSSLQRHLEQVTEEKEEREKEAVSWFNALEVAESIQLALSMLCTSAGFHYCPSLHIIKICCITDIFCIMWAHF